MLGRCLWVLVARSSALVVQDHAAHLRGATLRVAGAHDAPREVPTHLACISALAVLYFSAYLFNIMARFVGSCWERCVAGHRPEDAHAKPEGRLAKAAEALVFVPALCTLFLATRVWTLATTSPDHGDLTHVMQSALGYIMYTVVGLVFAEYLCVALTAEDSRGRGASCVLWVSQAGVLVGACAILASIFTSPVRPSDATLGVTALLLVFFGIHTLLAIKEAATPYFGKVSKEDKERNEAEAQHVRNTLAVFPMLCVLLVMLRMRSLELDAPLHATTPLIKGLVASASVQVAAVLLQLTFPPCGPTSNLVGLDATRPCLAAFLSGTATVAMVCVYGCAAVLVSTLLMLEEDPSEAYAVEIQPTFLQAILRADPVPTSMKCVTILSVLFFFVYLSVLLSRSLQYCTNAFFRRQAYTTHKVERTLKSAEDAVLFVPMLSVLMIALRLRARTYSQADPAAWVQAAMYVCVASLILQVLMAPLIVASRDVFKDEAGSVDAWKLAALSFLVLRYLVLTVFYCGVAALVVAVWWQ